MWWNIVIDKDVLQNPQDMSIKKKTRHIQNRPLNFSIRRAYACLIQYIQFSPTDFPWKQFT